MEVERDAEYFDYVAGLSQFASASRFVDLKHALHKPSPWGNSKKGTEVPFLVVLQGIAKGENRNSPFAILSFDRQRRFLSHVEKESGVETFPAHEMRG